MKYFKPHYMIYLSHLLIGAYVLMSQFELIFLLVYAIIASLFLYRMFARNPSATVGWVEVPCLMLLFLSYLLLSFHSNMIFTEQSVFILIFWGILVIISTLLTVLPINRFVGVRTKGTLQDEVIWKKANTFLAFIIQLVNLPLFLVVFYLEDELKRILSFVGIAMVIIVTMIYTELVSKARHRKKILDWREKQEFMRHEQNKHVKDKYKDPMDT